MVSPALTQIGDPLFTVTSIPKIAPRVLPEKEPVPAAPIKEEPKKISV